MPGRLGGRAIFQAWVMAPAPVGLPSRPRRYSSSVPILKPQLPAFLRGLIGIGQSIIVNDLSGPVATRAFGSELGRYAGQEDAHRCQPLLAVDHANGLDYPRRSGFREGEECTAVVRCVGTTYRDRQEVLNQSFDVSLTPTVPPLPARYDVLDLSVQEFEEIDVMGLHGGMITASASRSRQTDKSAVQSLPLSRTFSSFGGSSNVTVPTHPSDQWVKALEKRIGMN